MLCVQRKHHVQGLDQPRVGTIVLLVQLVEHVQKVLGIVQVVAGKVGGASDAVSVGGCCHGGRLSQDAHNLLVADALVVEKQVGAVQCGVGLRVERRHCRHRAKQVLPHCST